MKPTWFYYRGARKYVVMCVFFLALTEILALVLPMLLKATTELATVGATTWQEIVMYGVIVLGVIALIFIMNFFGEIFGAVATAELQKNLRAEMFEKLQTAPAERVNELGSGKILPLVMNDTSWIKNMQRNILLFIVYFPIAILGSIVMLFTLGLFYGLFALASLPFVILFLYFNSRRLAKIMEKSIAGFDTTHVQVKEGIIGAKEIRVFNKAKQREQDFEQLFWYGRLQTSQTLKTINLSTSFHAVLFTLVTVAIIIYGACTMTDVGQLVVLNTAIIYVNWLWSRSREVFKLFVDHIPRIKIAKERIALIYNLPADTHAHSHEGGTKPEIADTAGASLILQGLEYKYPNGVTGLADVNVAVEKDTRVAIAGGAGSGRTVIPQILLQFLKPSAGKVLLGGTDISEIDPTHYRRNLIAYCDQVPEFIPGTIRDNLRLLNPAATDAEILRVFREIGARSFVERFDNFLEHNIGERDGFNMATRKLLNLVRTLLKPAPVYIFDQCFDHLRAEYLEKFFAKLEREKKTCLFITQNAVLSKHCDKIYVMKKGAVSAVGTHDDLVKSSVDYCDLCLVQGGSVYSEEVANKVPMQQPAQEIADAAGGDAI